MTFDDVLEDIKKLIGLELHSIRPGANLRIVEIDKERACLIILTAKGVKRSRPLSELQTIWNEMNRIPAVHVDEVLHGSGTSRNQPETILANLPYVEWLRLDSKKHIAFVGKETHPYGTLKQMDLATTSFLQRPPVKKEAFLKTKIVIVTSDITGTVSTLQRTVSGTVSTISQGAYLFESASMSAIIISTMSTSLSSGTFPILSAAPISGVKTVSLLEKDYYVVDHPTIKFLIEK